MVNLSHHYFTEQDSDYEEIRKLVPDVALYVEMTHATSIGKIVTKREGDNFSFRRTTKQQFYTTAHLVYSAGLDGITAFNFVYYRPHGGEERGPFNEPPFEAFKHLDDPAWLATQPQHYFLGNVWNCPRVPNRPLPKKLGPGETATFELKMAPPAGGWKKDGRLRIQAEKELGESRFRARMNGVELVETRDRSEPYENPYSPMLGTTEQLRAWIVPADLMKDGANQIEVTMVTGDKPVRIIFLDLAAGVKEAKDNENESAIQAAVQQRHN
jgi:hypothetical protein